MVLFAVTTIGALHVFLHLGVSHSFSRCFDRHQGFVIFVETAAVLSTCFYANKISKATAGGKSCWSVPMSEDVLLVQLVDHW